MPLLAILLSVLGLLPFIGCGLLALGPDPLMAARMMSALIAWGAVALAFAGGVHWGFELQRQQENVPMQRARLGLGVLPLLVGWIALLLPLVAAAWMSLIVLIAAYLGTVAVEHRASAHAMVTARYLWLRWGFTVIAVAIMVTVLTLHLFGQTVII
jgi:hypothetical protein